MSVSWMFALKNLGRNKKRNFATASAIVLGFAGLLLLCGFVIRIEKFFRAATIYMNHTGSVVVYKPEGVQKHLLKPKEFSLTATEQQAVITAMQTNFPDLEFLAAHIDGFALAGNGCRTFPVRITGVPRDVERRIFEHPMVREHAFELLHMNRGRGLWEYPDVVTSSLTPKATRRLGKPLTYDEVLARGTYDLPPKIPDCSSPGSRAVIAADSNVQIAVRTFGNALSAMDTEVVNNFSSGYSLLEETAAIVPFDALQKLLETDMATYVAAYLPWDVDTKKAAVKLDGVLQRQGLNLDVFHFGDPKVSPFYHGFMNLIYMMSTFFLSLALLIVTLSVGDTMSTSIMERTREIGTLRAMGFRRSDIINIFAKESILLVSLSVPIGLVVALIIGGIVNALEMKFAVPGVSSDIQIILKVEPWAAFAIGALEVLVALVAGFVTSVRVVRRDICDLLYTHVS